MPHIVEFPYCSTCGTGEGVHRCKVCEVWTCWDCATYPRADWCEHEKKVIEDRRNWEPVERAYDNR